MKRFVAGLSLGLIMMTAQAAPMNNADVIKMLESGMPESVILQSIATSATKFDVSSDALIKLQKKGASAAVLQAVINTKDGHPVAAAAESGGSPAAAYRGTHGNTINAGAHGNAINPEEALVVTGGAESPMQYIVPQVRTAARVFGLGGVATYASLQGTTAARKLPGEGLEFIVSVPKNAQPVSYVTLANFAVRNNGTREVMIGGGYMSYSSGINKDRVGAGQNRNSCRISRVRATASCCTRSRRRTVWRVANMRSCSIRRKCAWRVTSIRRQTATSISASTDIVA